MLLGAVTAALSDVTVVTEERFRPLVERLGGVARTRPWAELRAVTGEVVDLQRDLATLTAHPRAARIRKHTARRALSLLGWPIARPDVIASYGRAAGVRPRPPPWIEVERRGEALALVPGASTALKQWSPERFVAVGRAWGGEVVVLGGPGEERLVGEVAGGIPRSTAVVEEGFGRTVDVLGRCAVVVGGDTGLVHLAAACGARPIVVFGPTHPRDGYFAYANGAAVQLGLPCRPCTRHRRTACRAGHHACVDIDVRSVVDAVRGVP
ncbi:MAG: glycosyltransferase family 9 protein [Alphaproteobacteria bacterium]|nr:glycosyltransferase family 9 protein [Alphaproteobacteria bacterium]